MCVKASVPRFASSVFQIRSTLQTAGMLDQLESCSVATIRSVVVPTFPASEGSGVTGQLIDSTKRYLGMKTIVVNVKCILFTYFSQ